MVSPPPTPTPIFAPSKNPPPRIPLLRLNPRRRKERSIVVYPWCETLATRRGVAPPRLGNAALRRSLTFYRKTHAIFLLLLFAPFRPASIDSVDSVDSVDQFAELKPLLGVCPAASARRPSATTTATATTITRATRAARGTIATRTRRTKTHNNARTLLSAGARQCLLKLCRGVL